MKKSSVKLIKAVDNEIKNIRDYYDYHGSFDIGFVWVSLWNKTASLVFHINTNEELENCYNLLHYFYEEGYDFNYVKYIFMGEQSLGDFNIKYLINSKRLLDKKDQSLNFHISYGYNNEFFENRYSDCDDFIQLIECIKYYRSLINDYEMTPLEKMTFAYDICKSLEYRKTDNNFSDNSLHRFVKTGNIVCGGYTLLLKEILKGIDPNIKFTDFDTKCYGRKSMEYGLHSRGIVRIDDEYYNVHGIYCLDPTWDSVKNSEKIYGKWSDAFSGYKNFLVPISKYRSFFKNNTYPRLFNSGEYYRKEKYLTSKKLGELSSKSNSKRKIKDIIDKGFYPLIDEKMTCKEFFKYLNCERIDVEEFLFLISTVRLFFEGYSTEKEIYLYGINSKDKYEPYALVYDPEMKMQLY